MKGKRFLALVLSFAMVAGSGLTVFAADKEGSEEASGEVQYLEKSDIFDVVLPTDAGTTFDYLLDPEGLIKKTNGGRYSGKAFDDDKTVYFLHAAKVDGIVGGTAGTANCDYTDTSDAITVTNKSTKAVDVKVTAKISAADGVTMATAPAMSGDGENFYMAIVGKNDTDADETKAITTAGVELTGSIAADPNAYEVRWNTNKYEKVLTAAAQATGYTGFKSYTFKLTGACKANDISLTALKENPPKITLTWSVKDFTVPENSAPSIATRSYSVTTNTAFDIPVSLGTGNLAAQGVSSVLLKGQTDLELLNGSGTFATYADGKISLTAATATYIVNNPTVTLDVTFDDTTGTKVSISFTVASAP